MSPWLAKMLAMLLVLGYTAGFETKMCNHEETVENIKKTYECAVDFGKNFIKKGKELASGGIYIYKAVFRMDSGFRPSHF